MNAWRWGSLAAAVMAATACGSVGGPVPVVGPTGDVGALAGVWEGTYESAVTGRSGTIRFQLEVGQDTAFGSVIMYPGSDPVTGGQLEGLPAAGAQWLDINFVRCEDGVVTGTLGPYPDPSSAETLSTVFVGTLTEGVIEGTFTTRIQRTGDRVSGRWRVDRKGDVAGETR